jgi:hypothetical protein
MRIGVTFVKLLSDREFYAGSLPFLRSGCKRAGAACNEASRRPDYGFGRHMSFRIHVESGSMNALPSRGWNWLQ